MRGVWFHERAAYRGQPEGITVSKHAELPGGDFLLTEYIWGNVSLWFLDVDEFTKDERWAAYEAFLISEAPHA